MDARVGLRQHETARSGGTPYMALCRNARKRSYMCTKKDLSLTSVVVRELWTHMLLTFGATVEAKQDAQLMRIAAALLNTLNIQDKETFLKSFVTTIDKTIYIPFDIGIEGSNGQWSYWSQIRLCVHEHQHVLQGTREGWAAFDTRYLISSAFRAGYEAEAYGCDMEMEWWRHGAAFDVEAFAKAEPLKLKRYGCKTKDIEQAQHMLLCRAALVKQGLIETGAGQCAIAWLNQHAPDLKGYGRNNS